MKAIEVLRARSQEMLMTAIDLGDQATTAPACDDIVKGLGTQRTHD